jgi:hypothetical protein
MVHTKKSKNLRIGGLDVLSRGLEAISQDWDFFQKQKIVTSFINCKIISSLDIQRQAALHDCLPRLLGDGDTQIEL